MAVPFHTTTSTSYLHSGSGLPRPSLSCANRVFVGFKLQSPGSFHVAKPKSHFGFRTKLGNSTQSRMPCMRNIQLCLGKVLVHKSLNLQNPTTLGANVCSRSKDTDGFPVRYKAHFAANGNQRTQMVLWLVIRTIGSKPTQGCVKMFFETPVVSLTAPGQKSRQWMDVWTALNRKRIVFITGYIYDELSNDILSTMLYLDTSGSDQPMLFIINSIGGEVNASLTIYDTMQTLKSPVGTRCVGVAENMAGFLLAAGDKGSRAALPHSNICLESLSGTAFGQADDVCVEADEISRVTNYLCSQLATKTGQPVDKIHKDLEAVMNFSAQEALEYGLIDRIVRPPRLTPNPSKKGTWSLLNF